MSSTLSPIRPSRSINVEDLALIALAEQHDAVGNQLQQVLVLGDDHGVEPGRLGLTRKRADHVVGFVFLELHDRNAEHSADLLDVRDLLPDLGRSLRPAALVVGVGSVANGRAAGVEHRRAVVGLLFLQELAQHGGEAVDRVGGQAIGVRQLRKGVKGPEDLTVRVDEK
jgi:hypothetical protein